MADRSRHVFGWVAVGLSTAAACYWAVWGVLENFHEGWWSASTLGNLRMMLAQYLAPAIVFTAAAIVGVGWPRVGGGVHLAAACVAAWFFRGSSPKVIYPFIIGPLALMGALYWFGRVRRRRWAVVALISAPLATGVGCAVEPALRVAGRHDDGDRGARRLTGNGVDLVWAPEGPGWPDQGVTWEEARLRCRYLNDDGVSLAERPQDVWRLPTAEEAVRSMRRHDQECGGTWDPARRRASYRITPDKETPLWDTHSKVIYWWTATEAGDRESLIIAYDGKVWPRPKHAHWGYLGFRAVRDGPARRDGRPGA